MGGDPPIPPASQWKETLLYFPSLRELCLQRIQQGLSWGYPPSPPCLLASQGYTKKRACEGSVSMLYIYRLVRNRNRYPCAWIVLPMCLDSLLPMCLVGQHLDPQLPSVAMGLN